MDPEREARIVAAIHNTEVALWAKGYSSEQAAACVKTARKWAQGIADKVSPEIRDQTFEDLLRHRLTTAEKWIERTREGVSAG